MEIKPNELTNLALEWAVAKCEYPDLAWGSNIGIHHASHQIVIPHLPEPRCYWNPSSDWAQGGPIIERERLNLRASGAGDWVASTHDVSHPDRVVQYGPTPLIAAMRCYVASKLGDEVDIPEELS